MFRKFYLVTFGVPALLKVAVLCVLYFGLAAGTAWMLISDLLGGLG